MRFLLVIKIPFTLASCKATWAGFMRIGGLLAEILERLAWVPELVGSDRVCAVKRCWSSHPETRYKRLGWSDLVFGSRLDPCHDQLEFISQSGMGSHWPSRDRWRLGWSGLGGPAWVFRLSSAWVVRLGFSAWVVRLGFWFPARSVPGLGGQTWFLVPGSIRAMISWSSSASRRRARTGHRVIDGALKLDAKSSGHFPGRAHSSEGHNIKSSLTRSLMVLSEWEGVGESGE